MWALVQLTLSPSLAEYVMASRPAESSSGIIELDQPIGDSLALCRLSPASAADIAAIELESNSPPWTEALFLREFQHDFSTTFGARTGGQLVGFLVCHTVHDESHIMNFGVRASARGRGVGRALISYVLRELYQASIRWVTLEVRRSNRRARNLYDSLGFLEVGLRERYYTDNHEDALVMRLSLQQFINQFGWDDGALPRSGS